METNELNLGDIPELPSFNDFGGDTDSKPFEDGWYEGTIVESRTTLGRDGNERVFASGDEPSLNSDSRNVKLQVIVKRKSDGRELNARYNVNYRNEDLTPETVNAVIAHQTKVTSEGAKWDSLFRPFLVLKRLRDLQEVAGVRSFQRNGNGGLDLHGLYGKKVYTKLVPDDRNPQYKAIKEVRATAPKRAVIL